MSPSRQGSLFDPLPQGFLIFYDGPGKVTGKGPLIGFTYDHDLAMRILAWDVGYHYTFGESPW